MQAPTMQERQKVFMSIMEKASEDGEFRAAMLADARSAINEEFDIQVPENVRIVVHENDSETMHLPLPVPLPAIPKVLSEGDLRQVSGGGDCHVCSNSSCI